MLKKTYFKLVLLILLSLSGQSSAQAMVDCDMNMENMGMKDMDMKGMNMSQMDHSMDGHEMNNSSEATMTERESNCCGIDCVMASCSASSVFAFYELVTHPTSVVAEEFSAFIKHSPKRFQSSLFRPPIFS